MSRSKAFRRYTDHKQQEKLKELYDHSFCAVRSKTHGNNEFYCRSRNTLYYQFLKREASSAKRRYEKYTDPEEVAVGKGNHHKKHYDVPWKYW